MPAGFAGLLGFGGRKKNKLKNGIGQSLALVALFVAGLAALAALGGSLEAPQKTTPDGAYSVTVNVGYAGGSQMGTRPYSSSRSGYFPRTTGALRACVRSLPHASSNCATARRLFIPGV